MKALFSCNKYRPDTYYGIVTILKLFFISKNCYLILSKKITATTKKQIRQSMK